MNERIEWLDGIRGVAALSVTLAHLLGSQGEGWANSLLLYTSYPILNILWNGSAAVSIFFVLSGYVLTLGIQRGGYKSLSWITGFLVGRIFRIALPFWVAVFVTLFLFDKYFDIQVVQAATNSWFTNSFGKIEQIYSTLLQQLVLIWPNTEHLVIPQGWTLTVELQISLLLPLIYAFLSRQVFLTVIIVLCLGVLLHQTFVFHFLLGMLLVLYQNQIKIWLSQVAELKRYGLFIGGLLLLTSVWKLDGKEGEILFWLVNGAGAAIVIALGESLESVKIFFKNKVFSFLGKISYSFYLTHMSVYFLLLPYLDLFAVFFIALFAATVFQYIVENPSVYLAKRVKKALE